MTSENLEYALFSREEMESRYARARERMARLGMDALLLSGEENFHYFAGATASLGLHQSLTRPSVFILPLDREPIIITQGRHNLELGTYVADLRDYSSLLDFPHKVVLDALQDVGLEHHLIGVELGQEQRMGMPVGTYLDLVAALPRTRFVDAADIFIELRMVKSGEELACMRKAADITGRARQRLFDQVEPGMTERQVARLLRQLVLEEGGDGTSFVILQLDLPGAGNPFHYDRPLEKGTVLAVDTGACVGMYTVDYPRMAVVGRATDEQRRVYRAVLEVNGKMADALRPGIQCSDLYQIGIEAVVAIRARGDDLEPLPQVRTGHGQGLQVTEPPSLCPEDHTVLEVGTVISTEPGVRCNDVQFLYEDVHVVTAEGHEQLTLETDELREIL